MRSPGEFDPASDNPSRAVPRLKRRADFVHVGKGRRWHGVALTLQTAEQRPGCADAAVASEEALVARVGFTLTRKVGNAVVRNRARRRLREAVRLSPELPLRSGSDYVIVGRLAALRLPFAELRSELGRAVATLQAGGGKRSRHGPVTTPAADTTSRNPSLKREP